MNEGVKRSHSVTLQRFGIALDARQPRLAQLHEGCYHIAIPVYTLI